MDERLQKRRRAKIVPFDAAVPHPQGRAKRRAPRDTTPEVRVVGSIDYAILFIVSVLVLIGVVMVFSASYQFANMRFDDPLRFLRRNVVFAGAGFFIMLFLANFNYELIRPMSTLIYAISVGLLIMVIFFGEEIQGARRWIDLPIIGPFQPSEVARAAIVFIMAYMIEKYPKLPRNFLGIVFLTGIVGVIAFLIWYPGGTTVAIVTTIIGVGIIAVASPFFWRLVVAGGFGAAGFVGFLYWQYITGGGFRGGRFGAWLDPWSDPQGLGFQIINSLYAIASGGWFGVGIGNSQQVTFIPEPQNDFIFAVIVEELGFMGALVIIILFALFIWRGIITSMRAPDTFSSLVALGIVFALAIPAVINIGVVTNTIPNTGVNLPFISYGGTSLLVSMALVGVLLNISRYSVQRK